MVRSGVRRERGWRSGLALLAGFAVAAAWVPASPAQGQQDATIAHAADFASDAYGQPWDFTDGGQVVLDSGPSALPGARIEDGLLRFTLAEQGHTPLVWHGYPGAFATGRDGAALPVDADRYTHVSLRVRASQQTTGSIFWDLCVPDEGEAGGQCRGNVPFRIDAGWNTVQMDLAAAVSGDHRWAGQVYGVWLGFAGGTDFDVDWARLYEPTSASLQAESWDDLSVSGDRGRGDTSGEWDPDAYPPGVYELRSGGQARTVEIPEPPRPVFDAPHERGGEDYATAVRGNPWNMQRTSDVASLHNVRNVSFSDGTLHANNGPPHQEDPHFYLAMGPRPLDPHRYHRLTVVTDYDGPFGLADAPGGGAHGRLSWRTRSIETGQHRVPGTVFQSRELVTYTHIDSYTVSLKTAPPEAVMEPDLGYRYPWTVSPVTAVRYDPNEDPGARRWRVRSVELRADHEARGGVFDIRLSNAAGSRPATLSLHAVPDSAYRPGSRPSGGIPIAEGITVPAAGQVTHRWDTTAVLPDRYRLWVEGHDGVTTVRRWASGPLEVPGRFTDTSGNPHIAAIYAVAGAGITQGCTVDRYCPRNAVTRGQMATFLTRALDLEPGDGTGFPDVPPGHAHAAGISAVGAAGIAEGLADGTFAPNRPVRRDQMASFLARALDLSGSGSQFADTAGNVHAPAISAIADAGITQGCGGDRYCPAGPVRRDQMAAFLARALGL